MAVFDNFPFTRSVQQTEDGREIDNTVICVTDRPLTDEELKKAKGGEDVDKVDNTDEEVIRGCQEAHGKAKKANTCTAIQASQVLTRCCLGHAHIQCLV